MGLRDRILFILRMIFFVIIETLLVKKDIISRNYTSVYFIEYIIILILAVFLIIWSFNTDIQAKLYQKRLLKDGFKKNSEFNVFYREGFEDSCELVCSFLREENSRYKDFFISKNFCIVLCHEQEDMRKYGVWWLKVAGLYRFIKRAILIECFFKISFSGDENGSFFQLHTLYHEWGHFVDDLNNNTSLSIEFYKIYFSEKIKFFRECFKNIRDKEKGEITKIYYFDRMSSIKNIYGLRFIYLWFKPPINRYKNSREFFAENYADFRMLQEKDGRLLKFLETY